MTAVNIDHLQRSQKGRGAAWDSETPDYLADDVRVGVALVEEERTIPGAVVGFVALRSDDPVPAKGFEVDRQRVSAAARIGAGFHAVEFSRTSPTVQ